MSISELPSASSIAGMTGSLVVHATPEVALHGPARSMRRTRPRRRPRGRTPAGSPRAPPAPSRPRRTGCGRRDGDVAAREHREDAEQEDDDEVVPTRDSVEITAACRSARERAPALRAAQRRDGLGGECHSRSFLGDLQAPGMTWRVGIASSSSRVHSLRVREDRPSGRRSSTTSPRCITTVRSQRLATIGGRASRRRCRRRAPRRPCGAGRRWLRASAGRGRCGPSASRKWRARDRAGDGEALGLPARELVRAAVHELLVEPDGVERLAHHLVVVALRRRGARAARARGPSRSSAGRACSRVLARTAPSGGTT